MSGSTNQFDPVEVATLSPEQIDAAVAAALAALASAPDLVALKQVRLEHTGDRSPLALANREIGALPPAARKDAGQRVGVARAAVAAALAARRVELEAERDARVLRRGGRRRDASGAASPAGCPAPAGCDRRADRGRLRRDGLGDRRGARGRGGVVQLRRAELRPRPSRPADAGHLLRRAAPDVGAGAAHPHLAGAGPRPARARAAGVRRRARGGCSAPTSSTPRTRRSSTRSRASRSTRA